MICLSCATSLPASNASGSAMISSGGMVLVSARPLARAWATRRISGRRWSRSVERTATPMNSIRPAKMHARIFDLHEIHQLAPADFGDQGERRLLKHCGIDLPDAKGIEEIGPDRRGGSCVGARLIEEISSAVVRVAQARSIRIAFEALTVRIVWALVAQPQARREAAGR